MTKPQFPQPFVHSHDPIRNVNKVFENQLTFGQRLADGVANMMGSWAFIGVQSVILAVWVTLNVIGWIRAWDPYPFILMNLILSMQAAYAAPVIMMSQNRQSVRDRLEAHNDFEVNQKTEVEVRAILDHLAAQDLALSQLHNIISDLREQLAAK
ncbi:MAG TPA: DUF1003 domain-containing protein [Spirochaetia bacterium]|nr:DUF1003 domain-containing protein [Spirochaetia bacterium]